MLLLARSESPEWATRGTKLVSSLFPNSRVVVLEGQGHVALMTAPALLVAELTRFLTVL